LLFIVFPEDANNQATAAVDGCQKANHGNARIRVKLILGEQRAIEVEFRQGAQGGGFLTLNVLHGKA
jgi:hypothetical protein